MGSSSSTSTPTGPTTKTVAHRHHQEEPEDLKLFKRKLIAFLRVKHQANPLTKDTPFNPNDAAFSEQLSQLIQDWATHQGVRKRLELDARNFITIKLLITPPLCPPSWMESMIESTAQFGGVHTGLQINDCLIGWFECGLVEFKDVASRGAAALIDLLQGENNQFHNQIEATEPRKQAIVNTIVDWNRTKTYSALSSNSQDFIADLFQQAAIHPEFPECITEYFKDVKNDPINGAKPHITENGVRIDFKTHEEFDKYAEEAMSNQRLLPLLRAFDRAFQLQEQAKGNYMPSQDCPFYKMTRLQDDWEAANPAQVGHDAALRFMPKSSR